MTSLESARSHKSTAHRMERDDISGKDSPLQQPERRDHPDASRKKEVSRRRSMLRTAQKRPFTVGLVALVLVTVLAGLVAWWLHARHFESTDDAFIDARVVQIGPQEPGLITDVPVTDNQDVTAGAVLVRIDQRNYRAALEQARGTLAESKARVANDEAQIDAQRSQIDQAHQQVEQAQAALKFFEEENQRYQRLLQQGSGTEQRAQQASSDLTQKRASLASAQASAASAEKQLEVLRTQRDGAVAQVEEAQAGLDKAEADLARTVIVAPEDGRVAKLSAAKGAYAQPGQALLMFVPRNVWITANFKETQLTDMRPGQPVDIEIDAYPDRDFHGRVDSIQPGSGTAFSLLPPENATGNYVKVVQRVPVKIVFDKPASVYLGPGMSVVPRVRVR
ncbi:MAG: Membrane fusion component of MSF-type tripartite multidrug efflux system [Pseudolabrys sp.]|jgi:membrane fusion protein (multidrug efflux system)|nr:Membrane fusion component of MSF-type tripartite multidrug efflux system [Pseudolabrys sp.]